jgi:UDPglucose 6-dehydrogenase
MGHTVSAVDIDAERIQQLQQGHAQLFEPGLDDLIAANLKAGRISFTTDITDAVPNADAVLLCVPTPAGEDGNADLSMLYSAVQEIGSLLRANTLVVTRSTVPVGTNAELAKRLTREHPDSQASVVSNPEFLREGHAVEDFLQPARVVIGAVEQEVRARAANLYEAFDCPIIMADLETAEIAKYAANAFLATSVSFINEIANICELTGADIEKVTEALALDKRIGPDAYIEPGIGFGGSCLPKDVSALAATAEAHGYEPELIRATINVNARQPERIVEYLNEIFPSLADITIAVLGISFKGDTFDVRSSPALALIRRLNDEGATLHAFDPYADETAESCAGSFATLHNDAYEAAASCDAVIIATDHSEFRDIDLPRLGERMRSRIVIDGRNMLDPEAARSAGFAYVGVGRGRRGN